MSSALLTFFFLMAAFAPNGATGSQKERSSTARDKITAAVNANPDKVLVFDGEGNTKESVTPTESDRATYDSLERFVQSSRKSPVDSCHNPTAVPPPPCILCDNGRIVCSKVKFRGTIK